jgi:hypothetical protein
LTSVRLATMLERVKRERSFSIWEEPMRNLVAAHPPWRQLVIISVALPVAITLAVLAFAWPAARIRPRDLPVGIVGPSAAAEQFIDHVGSADPDAFDFHLYPDDDAAIAAIRQRDIYGAFVVGPATMHVLEASAAGPAVAQLLTDSATKAAAVQPARLIVTDVVPLSSTDRNGMVFSSSLLPLTICSVLIAGAIGLLIRFRPAWRQLVALTVVSAVAAAAAYLIGQTFLGALPANGAADWAALALTILAMSAATAGLVALIGLAGLGLAAALLVLVGNPFSGATSAPELLPDAVNHVGQWLPPGAGANLLRSTAYFDGNGAAGHLGVLIAWVVVGLAAVFVGHHAPIRFAAHTRPEPQPIAPDVDGVAVPAPVAVPGTASTAGEPDQPGHLIGVAADERD